MNKIENLFSQIKIESSSFYNKEKFNYDYSKILDKRLVNIVNHIRFINYNHINNNINNDIKKINKYPDLIKRAVLSLLNLNFPIELVDDLISYFKSDNIPYFYPSEMLSNALISNIILNIHRYYRGYSLINLLWVNKLIKFIQNKKVLEVMSGTGFLANILKNKGIDIISTDNYSWEKFRFNTNKIVKKMDAIDALNKYKDRDIILMSWAPLNNIANKILLKMREINPNAIMIYIGEPEFGCNANNDFFKNIYLKYNNDINYYYQNIYGFHDEIMLIK